MHLVTRLILITMMGLALGCSGIKRGNLAKVSAVSDHPRAGKVYLVRGLVGVFSTGMDDLAAKIRKDGLAAEVYQGEQRRLLADAIAKAYAGERNPEPLVLIGHSYGADDVIRIARDLEARNVTVDLLVTCDAVTPPEVPSNIRQVLNYYKPQGALDNLPWLRGVPLKPEDQGTVQLTNYDLTSNRRDLLERGTNHFNIEKNQKLHADILKRLERTCPPRTTWASRQRTAPPVVHAVSNPLPTTRPVAASASAHSGRALQTADAAN